MTLPSMVRVTEHREIANWALIVPKLASGEEWRVKDNRSGTATAPGLRFVTADFQFIIRDSDQSVARFGNSSR